MKFCALPNTRTMSRVYYDNNDMGFYTKPNVETDFTIMIRGGYTGLDVSSYGNIVYGINGLNPKSNWKKRVLQLPDYQEGLLQVILDEVVDRGIGLNYTNNWETYYDEARGLICIGEPKNIGTIRFLDNCFASLDNGILYSVWIYQFELY